MSSFCFLFFFSVLSLSLVFFSLFALSAQKPSKQPKQPKMQNPIKQQPGGEHASIHIYIYRYMHMYTHLASVLRCRCFCSPEVFSAPVALVHLWALVFKFGMPNFCPWALGIAEWNGFYVTIVRFGFWCFTLRMRNLQNRPDQIYQNSFFFPSESANPRKKKTICRRDNN